MPAYIALPLLMVAALGTSDLRAQEPIRFARTPDISPDGKRIAFSYLGDIWTVEAIGGVARPVTFHEAHDIYPVFSPDGRYIAFSSSRHGNYDVFVIPAHGGRSKRLTFDSSDDIVCGWSPDGKSVVFSSSRGLTYPRNIELFHVPAEGGAEKRLPIGEGKEAVYSPDGSLLAYNRGFGLWYRKGYRGSTNDDIYLAKPDGSMFFRVTDFNGQDTSPMFAANGRRLYYVSEKFGTPANIVAQDLGTDLTKLSLSGSPKQLTQHTEDSVRRARISGNGEYIVYECGADLWLLSTQSGQTRKLAIEVHADDKVNPERTVTFTNGIREFAPSPDEKHVAINLHGEIFLMPITGGKAQRVTDHPAYDHSMSWAPDGKSLIFASDRDGHENIYRVEADDPEHSEFTKAHRFKVTQLTKTPEAEIGIQYTPDGKRISFVRAGQLWTMKPDGSDQQVLVADKRVIDYEFSPDGKWVVYARMDGSFASELYLKSVAGGEARNITRYATFNTNVTWSITGNRLAFLSERRNSIGMHTVTLHKPTVGGSTPSGEFDLDDIHLRAERVSFLPADNGAVSRDGAKIAMRANGDLWVASSDGREISRITSTGGVQAIRWSRLLTSTNLLYFLDGSGTLRTARVGSGGPAALLGALAGSNNPPPSTNTQAVNFTARMVIRKQEEFTEMFDQAWRALADSFYDKSYHGANWQAVRAKYRPLIPHIALKEDLYAMISLMLGELNASHLGISGPTGSFDREEVTPDFGILFDESFAGPGLKVAEILKRGPADKRGLQLKPGDIILAIERTDITSQTNLAQVLNGKVGETLQVKVTSNPADPKATRKIELQAVNRNSLTDAHYDRWVERNAAKVTELSKGKLGYVHIPSMDQVGLERFVRSLYSDNFDKEGLIIDVRYNGGGFTHDQVLNYITGKQHTIFRQRDGGEGGVLRSFDRKYSRPMTVLINNRSFSDAEIFPNAFRTLGLGKLVGQATGGYVIGTSGIQLIDGSTFRIPRIGVYTTRGVNMDKEGVMPDILVEPTPEDALKGIDRQLEKAVQSLTQEVAQWKARNNAVGGGGTGVGTGSAPAPQ